MVLDSVSLEFKPARADRTVHALDLDAGSVPGLKSGAAVPIVYPVSDPRAGRMVEGARRYGDDAFVGIVKSTFQLGAVVVGVLLEIAWIERTLMRTPPRRTEEAVRHGRSRQRPLLGRGPWPS
jgi:hypothetical protein